MPRTISLNRMAFLIICAAVFILGMMLPLALVAGSPAKNEGGMATRPPTPAALSSSFVPGDGMNARCVVATADLWKTPLNPIADDRMTQAVEGEPLQVLKEEGKWALVRVAHYNLSGWMHRESIGKPAKTTWGKATSRKNPLELAHTFVTAKTPYLWGGMSLRGVDCSGLVHLCYRQTGRFIPRDASQQEAAGQYVDLHNLRPGDLITYGPASGPLVGPAIHIAFFVRWEGQRRVILNARSGGPVREEVESPHLASLARQGVRF